MKHFKIINGIGMIPDGTTRIEDEAFKDCTDLVSITIPDSVTEIGCSAFEGCSSLEKITIGKSVAKIGNLAFRNCTSLKSIGLLHRLVKVDDDIFDGCTSLEAINVPANATAYYTVYLSEDVHGLIVELPTERLSAAEEAKAKAPLAFMTMPLKQAYLMEQLYSAVLACVSIDTDKFTPREAQIINGVLSGKSLKEIGDELHLFPGRVRQIWEKCLHKLPYGNIRIKK